VCMKSTVAASGGGQSLTTVTSACATQAICDAAKAAGTSVTVNGVTSKSSTVCGAAAGCMVGSTCSPASAVAPSLFGMIAALFVALRM
jgi:hypothetical protein